MNTFSHLEEKKNKVRVRSDAPIWTSSIKSADTFSSLGIDNSFDLHEFQKQFKINIQEYKPDEGLLVFDLIGVEAPIANAFRRILISEVPTVAIEYVYIETNTSIIQDEVLSHRLGLIPIKVDPRQFEYRQKGGQPTDDDTVVFKLEVKCTKKPGTESANTPEAQYENSKVYSGDLRWIPQGEQASTYASCPIEPVYKDILIAKLRPGQEIKLECHCVKGLGKDHAKWSPVATAFYRLLPEVTLLEEIKGKDAHELVAKCPMNVFDIEDIGGTSKAIVKKARNCTLCRECIREPGWDKKIKLNRIRNHFIFSIESTGILPPDALFTEAVKVLIEKCQTILYEIEDLSIQ